MAPLSRDILTSIPPASVPIPKQAESVDGGFDYTATKPVRNIRDLQLNRGPSRFPAFKTPAPRPKIDFTDEQNNAIHSNARTIVTKAFAGTGKTTMGVGFAEHRPRQRGLFVAFGKSTQLNAVERFPSTVDCRTLHSLGFQAEGRLFSGRTTKQWRAMTVREEYQFTSSRSAAIAQAIIKKFFQSASEKIGPEHAVDAETTFRMNSREISEGLQNAERMWRRMQDPNDKVSIPDDAYLKIWATKRPKLNYDYIIFDEFQDANPIAAQIIGMQEHAQRLYIGDPHQSIYAFRGATNAMNDFRDAEEFRLTQTWRFGPRTATVANLILSELKKETVQIRAMGRDEPYKSGERITKIARTNAELVNEAVMRHGQGVHWVGGVERYQLNRFIDAYNLFARKRDLIKDPFIRGFSTWGELQSYATEAQDPEAKVMNSVIEKYGHQTPQLIEEIRTSAVEDIQQSEIALTTGHQAKGLDWDYVEMAEDFGTLSDTEADLAISPNSTVNEQELNLLYVTVTRAKKHVELNSETKQWIEDLPTHRKARDLAMRRMDQSINRLTQVARSA